VSVLAHHINQQTLLHRIKFLNQVALSILYNFGFVAKQVMVNKQFLHLALDERFDNVVKVGWIFVSDKNMQFVAAVFGEVPIFLSCSKSEPSLCQIEIFELSAVATLAFADFF